MKPRILHFFFFILIFIQFSLHLSGQDVYRITGKVVESRGQQAIEFATVVVLDKENGQTLTGVTTGPDGTFNLNSSGPDIYLEVSFIGFATKTIESLDFSGGLADLGTILLSEDSEILDEVIVRGEKSTTEFKLDKRVFNVGKDLSTTGASALDVLNNVPSVNVNIEGQVTLRGSSGVQILINGKPSVLANDQSNALGTITADMIDQIEVITNPSAKYDAEGTSGIINIIIKKEERKGLNGSISVNTGLPNNHSVGLSLNRRTEKFNLFSQMGVGHRELPRDREAVNRDLSTNTAVLSEGTEYRNETFINLVLGTDYLINDNNILTLAGNFAYEIEDQPSRTDYTFLDPEQIPTAEWYRTETTEAVNPKYQYEVQYKRDFPKQKDHVLLISALGSFFGKDQSSEFQNINILGDNAGNDQETSTNFKEAKYTFLLDYTRPFSDEWTLETGAQYVLHDVGNDYQVIDLIDGDKVQNDDLTNDFEYNQKVLGIYATGAYEGEKWGMKLGLRMENTDLGTLLVNTNETNQRNFTHFFPTVHSSYKISERVSIQAGYSRRIFRPRLWDLNPFFNIRNNYSIRTGNPDLLPELTDSYEISSIFIFGEVSLNFSVYHRYTTDVVERISTFEDNVSTVRPENLGTNNATGIEFNGKYNATKWLTVNGDFNYYYFNRLGDLEGINIDFSAAQWSSKMTARFKLPANFEFETTGQYQSSRKTIQGEEFDVLYADLGIRKKIMKGRGVFNLSVRDVFASRIEEGETIQDDFYLSDRNTRGRFASIGFSFGFGKGEAMEYSGQRRFF